jgi:hypothetical protein
MDKPSLDQELFLLFSRLTWVSGIVREKACVAIADLIINSPQSDIIQQKLLNWIKVQKLESIAVIGLLVFCRIQITDNNFKFLPLEEFNSAINKPSILSVLLLNELFPNNIIATDFKKLHLSTAPSNFDIPSFFTKYSSDFLPPIYTKYAKGIEIEKRIPFIRQWAYEWQQFLEALGKNPSSKSLDFWGRQNYEHYITFDAELSEVYRSAYLRTLAWAVTLGAISEKEAKIFAAETCPIDLGLWRIAAASKPSCWPKVEELEGQIDTIPAQIWNQVEKAWQQQLSQDNDWIIAEASGRVYESGNTVAYDLEIFGLFQSCNGTKIPNFEEIAKWYSHKNFVPPPISDNIKLEGYIDVFPSNFIEETFGDWSVLPAAIPTYPNTVPRWQYWRLMKNIWLPNPCFGAEMLKFYCSNDALIIQDGEDIFAKWFDWTDGLGEKISANLLPATGQYLLIRRDKIKEIEEEINSVFCWVCRLTVYNRKYDGEPYEKFTDYSQYGATGIVRP